MANKKVSQLTSKPSVLTTDLFPIADPSTGQLYKTTISDLGTAIGSGVSSVNGLVGAVVLDTDDIQELVSPTNKWFTDTRARAALSASSPLTYNSGTGAFGIQEATSTQNGYLSSADWTTFNAKQAALSGTGFVKISGTTISYDNTSYLPLTGGTLTGNLNGTNITISNSLIAKGGTFNGGASSSGIITMDGLGSDLLMNRADSSNGALITLLTNANEMWSLGMRSLGNDNFYIYNSGLLANAVTINSTNSAVTLAGALSGTTANFSSNISVGGNNLTGGVLNIFKSNGWTVAGDGYTSIYSGTGFLGVIDTTGSTDKRFYLSWSPLTTSTLRTYTLPDASGTLSLTSDLSSYLPLSGGTLTGALSGTSITTNNTIQTNKAGGLVYRAYYGSGNNRPLDINIDGANGDAHLTWNTTYNSGWKYYLTNYAAKIASGDGLIFSVAGTGTAGNAISWTNALTLASSGAATFSSSVTAGGDISTSTVLNARTNPVSYGTSSSPYYSNAISFLNSTNVPAYIQIGNSGLSDYGSWLKFQVNSVNSANTILDVLTLSPQGGGRVGIGTSSPSQLLHLNAASGAVYNRIQNNNNSLYLGLESGGIAQVSSDASSLKVMGATYTSFETAGSERMRITSGGNILIGTTTDNGYKLEVNGTGRFTGAVAITTALGLLVQASSEATIRLNNTGGGTEWRLNSYTNGNLYFQSGAGATNAVNFTSAGAATFSSSVTAGNFLASNGGLFGWGAGSTFIDGDSSNQYIRFIVNNSERVRINSSGNVGIGTTSPANYTNYITQTINGTNGAIVQLQSSGTPSLRLIGEGVDSYLDNVSTGALIFRTTSSSSERMRITSGGSVGIGTTSPDVKLQVRNDVNGNSLVAKFSNLDTNGGTGAYIGFNTGYDATARIGALREGSGNNSSLLFLPMKNETPTEAMRITSGGNVLIANTSNGSYGSALKVATIGGSNVLELNQTGTSSSYFAIFTNGNGAIGTITTNGTTTAYNTTSDYRLKEDLKPINGLEIVNKIKVYDYKWKADNSRMDGVLAHELAEVLPYAVHGVKDGEQMQGVDYSKIVPVLIQSIKELKSKIETLENK